MNKKEILERMERINNFLKNKHADFSDEEFVNIDILAKTINMELEREYTEDYVSGVTVKFLTEDSMYHDLWCKAIGIWPNYHINNLSDMICEYCEKHSLTLKRVTLKFDTEVASSIDLLIEDSLQERASQRFLDSIVEHNSKLPISSHRLAMIKKNDDMMNEKYFNDKKGK